jgi:hypothetical protein
MGAGAFLRADASIHEGVGFMVAGTTMIGERSTLRFYL